MALIDVNGKRFKNFMAKLYGFGAAIVILGAMFKIMHWEGANYMLVIGLTTEAVIFFFSAFEKPATEYDWSSPTFTLIAAYLLESLIPCESTPTVEPIHDDLHPIM